MKVEEIKAGMKVQWLDRKTEYIEVYFYGKVITVSEDGQSVAVSFFCYNAGEHDGKVYWPLIKNVEPVPAAVAETTF